jgi:hypothetical protein
MSTLVSNRGGTNRRFPITPQLFPDLPGTTRGAELIGPLVFIELELRDQPARPREGLLANFAAPPTKRVELLAAQILQFLQACHRSLFLKIVRHPHQE